MGKKSSERITTPKKTAAATLAVEPKKIVRRGKGYSAKDIEYFKRLIQEKRKEIIEELESLKASMMDVETGEYANESSTYSLHMEQGTDAMEREKLYLFASREGKFLNYLDDALKRLDANNYGWCTECGLLIEKERLEAVPHTQQCVQCKLKKAAGQRV